MEENRIIEMLWSREENALEEVAGKYGTYCMSIALNIVGIREDAEECVSDAYRRAWNAIPPARPTNLRAYIGRLARNAAIDRLDYMTAACRDVRMNEIVDELGQCATTQSTEERYEQGEVGRAVNSFLGTLDKRVRQVFVRRYWYCDSISDIAGRFGMSQSAVKSMLARTRVKLRDHLAKEGFEV